MSANTLDTGANALTRRVSDTIWFNALWFQAVWFCAVLGRDTLLPVALALLVLHVWMSRDYREELSQLLLIGGIGVAVDAVLSTAGVYEFPGDVLVPLWLCTLWLAFAAALGRSLAWLAGRPLLTCLAGAAAFPVNYLAGQRLGAVEFGYSLPVTLALVAIIWAVFLPVMYRLTARLASLRDRE